MIFKKKLYNDIFHKYISFSYKKEILNRKENNIYIYFNVSIVMLYIYIHYFSFLYFKTLRSTDDIEYTGKYGLKSKYVDSDNLSPDDEDYAKYISVK